MNTLKVLVTGAASGIGAAIAREVLSSGGSVVGLDRVAPQDVDFPILQCDITDRGAVAAAVAEAQGNLGGIDALVCCAGVISLTHLDDLTEEEYERVIAVNLTGTLLACQAAYPIMRETGGSIALLSSIAARTGGVLSGPAYAASKGGVVSFGKWLAQDGASSGVRVNIVCPGPVKTPMILNQGYDLSGQNVPLGRLGTPEDIVGIVEYLISPRSGWITGQTIDVNGGLYIN